MASAAQYPLFEVTAPLTCAVISKCGRYRHSLLRVFSEGPILYWVMLNPSTADAFKDDPTVRKCIGFAKWNGFGAIMIENLVPFRATDPNQLAHMTILDMLGDRQCADEPLRRIPTSAPVVAGWGMHPYKHNVLGQRMLEVEGILNRKLLCVKQSAGRPWHPLYVPYGALEELNGD